MRIIKPYTEILTDLNQPFLKEIERVARTCYKSEDKISEDDSSARELVRKLIARGHEAMIEFGDITVKFVCDRGISHEIVRHRVASYAQESTRYCNYGKAGEVVFIEPNWLQSNTTDGITNGVYTEGLWKAFMEASEKTYLSLIEKGWSPQQARSVLPNSLKTEINVKMNIREWRHFFRMRCSNTAHPQMIELTRPLLKEFQEKIPVLFDDITY
jgi:thymidylate synthase (FAD)